MNPDPGLQRGFRLGDIEIDPLRHEVRSGPEVQPLSERATAFLMVLAEAPGQVVPPEHFRERFGHEDYGEIASSLEELQRALGDSPDHPRLVRQVGSEGFQLLSDISIDVPPIPTTEQIVAGGGKPGQ